MLHASGVFPPLGQPTGNALLLLATIYRTIFGIAGCYLTARLGSRETSRSHSPWSRLVDIHAWSFH